MDKHLLILSLEAIRLSLSRFLLRICGNCMVGVLHEFLFPFVHHARGQVEISPPLLHVFNKRALNR